MSRILSQIGFGLLSTSLVFALAACGAKDEPTNTEPTNTEQGGAVTTEGAGSDVLAAAVDPATGEHAGHEHAEGEDCADCEDGSCEGCGDEAEGDAKEGSCEGCGEEGEGQAHQPKVAEATGNMGITLEEFTPISTILATPADFVGKRVLIKGKALEACEKRGCWVELESDKAFQTIMVKVNDGEIVFPQECVGNEVVVEGEVQKLDLTVEQNRAMQQHKAEEQGKEFDPASVTEGSVMWRIRGLGAKFDS